MNPAWLREGLTPSQRGVGFVNIISEPCQVISVFSCCSDRTVMMLIIIIIIFISVRSLLSNILGARCVLSQFSLVFIHGISHSSPSVSFGVMVKVRSLWNVKIHIFIVLS